MSELSGLAGGFGIGHTMNEASSYEHQFVDDWFQRQAEERAQGRFEKNQQRNFELSQIAERQEMSNRVASFEKAGLSPLAVLGTSFSAPAPVGTATNASAPSGKPASMQDSLALAQLAGMQLQNDLLESEREKVDEETEGVKEDNTFKKRINDREDSYDNMVNDMQYKALEQQRAYYESKGDTAAVSAIDAVLSGDPVFNKGTMEAVADFAHADTAVYAEQIRKKVLSRQDNGSVLHALAYKDKADFDLVLKQVGLIDEQMLTLAKSRDLSDAQISEIQQKIELYTAEIKKLMADVTFTQNRDPVYLWQNDKVGATIYEVHNLLDKAEGAAGSYLGGYGMAKGINAFRRGSKGSPADIPSGAPPKNARVLEPDEIITPRERKRGSGYPNRRKLPRTERYPALRSIR